MPADKIKTKTRKTRAARISAQAPVHPDESLDAFYRGRVRVIQKKAGYRFSVDAPLLAAFIRTRPGEDILELGTGSGIIALLLGNRPFRRLTAVEIQPALADLARRNVALNGLAGRIRIVRADFRTMRIRKRFDVVVANPPYIRKTTGFLSASEEKSIAKHELKCDILDVMKAASERLKRNGRAYFIYPDKRRQDFIEAAERFGLRMLTLRPVRPRPDEPANLFLAECGFAAARPRRRPPLTLYTETGEISPEARRIFEGRARGPAD